MADSPMTRETQATSFDLGTTGASTNPIRTLFSTLTDNVSGRCA